MNVLPKKPEIVVFAGPNGSGKSTITELLMPLMSMKLKEYYFDECVDWYFEDIRILTTVNDMTKKDLN